MIQDVRYGIRMLLKRPGFASIAVMTLALGIGANLTIFSFVDTMFFRPLPASDPYRLVNVDAGLAYPIYKHFKDQSKSFEALAAQRSQQKIVIRYLLIYSCSAGMSRLFTIIPPSNILPSMSSLLPPTS